MKRILTALVFVIALAVSALFTSLNPGKVELDFGFAVFQGPLGLAFVLALAVGWVLGVLSSLAWVTRLLGERRRLRKARDQALKLESPVADERG